MEIVPLSLTQTLTFLVAVAVFLTTVKWVHQEYMYGGYIPYVLGPLLFSANLVLFYIALVFRNAGGLTSIDLNTWSSYLRLHGLISMWGIIIMNYYRAKRLRQ